MRKSLTLIPFALSATLLLSGCIGLHFGGGSKSEMQNRSQTYDVTLGQQLLDLQKAYDAGIISKSEYNSQKKKLLRHHAEH